MIRIGHPCEGILGIHTCLKYRRIEFNGKVLYDYVNLIFLLSSVDLFVEKMSVLAKERVLKTRCIIYQNIRWGSDDKKESKETK